MTTIQLVQEQLPLWLRWGAGLALVPVAFVAGFGAPWIVCRLALAGARVAPDAHWTEQARVSYPARAASGQVFIMGVTCAMVVAALLGPLASLPPIVVAGLIALAALWGAALAGRRYAPPAFRRGPLRALRDALVIAAFRLPAVLILVMLAVSLRPELDLRNVALGVLGFTAVALVSYYGGLPLLWLVGALRPASERVRSVVDRAAERAGVAPRKVFELDLPNANAFALLVPRWVVFTDACVRLLDDAQLQALAAHELGHLSEPRSVVLARASMWLAFMPLAFGPILWERIGPYPAVGAVFLPILALRVLRRRLSVRMEARADCVAHEQQDDPEVLARTLERLYEANLTPAVLSGKPRTHPFLHDRMLAHGVEPSWPRPEPPSVPRQLFAFVGSFVLFPLLLFAPVTAAEIAFQQPESAALRTRWSVALSGGFARDLFEIAHEAERRRDLEGAMAAFDLAEERYGSSHETQADRAVTLARLGECERAERALEDARASSREAQHADCEWVDFASSQYQVACMGGEVHFDVEFDVESLEGSMTLIPAPEVVSPEAAP